jgi:hypothetical protein
MNPTFYAGSTNGQVPVTQEIGQTLLTAGQILSQANQGYAPIGTIGTTGTGTPVTATASIDSGTLLILIVLGFFMFGGKR